MLERQNPQLQIARHIDGWILHITLRSTWTTMQWQLPAKAVMMMWQALLLNCTVNRRSGSHLSSAALLVPGRLLLHGWQVVAAVSEEHASATSCTGTWQCRPTSHHDCHRQRAFQPPSVAAMQLARLQRAGPGIHCRMIHTPGQ